MAGGTQLDYTLQAFSVAVAGTMYAGAADKCTLPKMKKKMEEHRGGGMLMGRKISLGYEAMEFGTSIIAADPNLLAQGGLYLGNRDLVFSVRGYLDGDNNAQHTAICQMAGEVSDLDFGDWSPGKLAKVDFKASLYAVALQIDSNTIWRIDAKNGIYNVGGNDFYAAIKTALGL
ncbi:phage major tail tube protein [Methylocystis heyeri]|uniref:Phage tail protein n=1 Tax=Methylocystis heyeri TaxID=391905 RepID=A0A6B8KGJ9_9HYPH|nr:phage major tail tube protein [Methylocystis heyeri]QGM46749.1 hypothetical protein H2LOC_014180 [Methylocystis heyeri]